MTDTTLALRIAALKVLSDYTAEKYEAARAEGAKAMQRGERIVARSPIDDRKIAVIPLSDPNKKAEIVDGAALLVWLDEHYPDLVDSDYTVIGSEHEVIQVLFQHAPHLLDRRKRINPRALTDIKQNSATLGQPIGPGNELDVPGVEVRTPDPVLTCRPTAEAFDIVRELHDQGRLLLDGTVTTALPQGDTA